VTASNGDESVTPASLSVSLSASYSQTVTVDYAVTGGMAMGGGIDYILTAGTLTFDPNDVSEAIDITIVDDGLDEPDETIEVTLSNPSNATLGANTVHIYTILDNDEPANSAPSVDAGSDDSVTLPTDTVNLNGTVTDDGLPDPPGAFTTLWTKDSGPGVVTFGNATAIDTTATVSQAGVYVLKLEADDGELTGSDTVTITVNAEPVPAAAFDLAGSSGDESATPASLSVSLSASYSQTVTVDYAVTGGDATGGGVDYTLAAGTLTFDPNDVSETIDITIVDDGLDEPDETIEVTLSNPTGATLGANTVHTYTILDNDEPANNAPSVHAGSDDSITLPTDTVNLNGMVTDDGLPDPPGAFTTLWTKDSGPGVVTFGNATAIDTTATVSQAGVYVLKLEADDGELTGSDTVTITVNAEPVPSVAFDLTGSSGDESVTPASLSVSLSASYSQTVTVDYAVMGGTAVDPDDYTIAGTQLTFDPGVTQQDIDISIVDDGEEEPDETIEVTLSNSTGATLGANTVHTYTIVDNEGPSQDFANADIPVTGDVSGSYLDTQASDDVYDSITEVRVGNPVKGFSALEHVWTIDVTGGLAVTFYVEAHKTTSSDGDDFVFAYSEDDDTYIDIVTVTKTADDDTSQSYVLPSSLVGTVYIRVTDTDHTRANQAMDTIYIDQMYIESAGEPGEPTVQFDLVSSSGDESVMSVDLAVSLRNSSDQTVTVDYAVTGGTADAPNDYTIAGTQLSFGPGLTTQYVPITVVDDGDDETDETIEVTLSSPSNASLGANTVHTYTILDNDGVSPPGQASNPDPANGATKVSRNATLSWTAGSGADSHDVYFGTNPNPGASEFQGNQAGTTFDPGYLGKNTWYYWRIDEVNAGGTTTGVVWSFKSGVR